MGKATNFKFGRYIQRVHPNKSSLKFWEKMERGHIQGLPSIISGTGKATNFKFCTHILSIDWNKSPLQISGKVVECVVRTLKTFQCTHILGASRGLLCDSSAVLFAITLLQDVTVWIHLSPSAQIVTFQDAFSGHHHLILTASPFF